MQNERHWHGIYTHRMNRAQWAGAGRTFCRGYFREQPAHTAAVTQTALLLRMNTGGLVWARSVIPDRAGMVGQNFAFAVLIWICR